MKEFEVVISGVAGAFPECNNLKELEEKIYTDENLVNATRTKWKTQEVPNVVGTLKEGERFDDTFFGVTRMLAAVMDPHTRQSFERSYEAILDAGRNPQDFSGTNVAVIMTGQVSETEGENMMQIRHIGHLLLGYSRCFQSNRLSYTFNFQGPSMTVVGSAETSLYALNVAHSMIRRGQVKAAIVGTANVLSYPQVSHHYRDMERLSTDGKTKSYSADADGYNRSDGIVVFFLERADEALRSYGTIVDVMCGAEMNYTGGLLEPNGLSRFLGDFYQKNKVDMSDIGYIEGNGQAFLEVDAMELNAMADVMCEGRKKPMLVSSSKSRLGYSEGAAASVSIATALVAMKTGFVPSVLHYTKPNPLVPALKDGRLKIVTEKTPLEGDYVAVNCIGMCSIFGHVLLKRNPNTKPLTEDLYAKDPVPRLFLLSGRNESEMKGIFRKVIEDPYDEAFFFLDHSLHKKARNKQLFRGYAIKHPNKDRFQVSNYIAGLNRPVWFIFSGMGSQWAEMGTGLMEIQVIRESIERSHRVLLPKGIDLIAVVTSKDPRVFDDILNCFIGIAAIQIALVDFLTALGIKPDGMVGHSVGELGCSYSDGCLTAEQMILAAHARGVASNEAELMKGMMAAVGMGFKSLRNEIPEGIEIACHNSNTSCTLSGPADLMDNYVKHLKSQGVFAKLVNVANIAYHSKNIAPAGPLLLKYLKEIIPNPKPRTSKWISSSVHESQWCSSLARFCSAEYHTNNLLSYVLFEEACAHIPEDAICIEIAPHGLLQAIVKKSLPTCTHISLTSRAKEGTAFTIEALGLLFNNGLDMDLTKVYPEVKYPVPRETAYLHPMVTWFHRESWHFLSLERDLEGLEKNKNHIEVELMDHEDELYSLYNNHLLFGTPVYPVAKLLCVMLDYMNSRINQDHVFSTYQFQDLKFHNFVNLGKKVVHKLKMLYQSGSGSFEILFGNDMLLLTGRLNPLAALPVTLLGHHVLPSNEYRTHIDISADSIYQYFAEKDFIFKEEYRNIIDIKISDNAFIGRVQWRGCLKYYLDSILKLVTFYSSINNDCIMKIDSISQFIIDTASLPQHDKDIVVFYDKCINEIAADGVRITMVKAQPFDPSYSRKIPEMGTQSFISINGMKSQNDFLDFSFHAVVESSHNERVTIVSDEKSSVFQQLMHHPAFTNHIKARPSSVKVMDFKELTAVSEKDSIGNSGCYLVITEDKLSDSFVSQLESSKRLCFVLQSANDIRCVSKFKKFHPVMEINLNNCKLILFKKTIDPVLQANFIQVPEGYLLEQPTTRDEITETKKSNFLLFKYRKLQDIPQIVEANKTYYNLKNTRFVFTERSSPPFNPASDFYLDQLKKDLKLNVCHKGVWGTYKDSTIPVPVLSDNELKECQLPLNRIRCLSVDLKYVGINMQNLVSPSASHEIGVLDYCGVRRQGQEEVMGLAKLSPDNCLSLDPVFVWKKPSKWTRKQAATVPLYYSMAYTLLQIKCMPEIQPHNRVFIHGAHTAFSQAFIRVALDMNITVYTTCFSQKQKQLIMKRFPQIHASNIYTLGECSVYSLVDDIMVKTAGQGVNLVMDCVDDLEFRHITMQCLGQNGKYFLICHNNTRTDFTFGMSIFLKEAAVVGFNPELMFDMTEEEKKHLVELVQVGIEQGTVVPLDAKLIDGSCSRLNVAKSLISLNNRQEEFNKVLLELDQKSNQKSGATNETATAHKKNYLIIGSYNSLWFDLMIWLTSRGASNIYIVMDQLTMPDYIQVRWCNFLKRHTSVNIRFLGLETLSSTENCDRELSRFADGKAIDKAFYIMPGLEMELEHFDASLRRHCPKCWLVCINNTTSNRITDQRNVEGLRGVNFILKKDSLRNRAIVNVLDHWFKRCHENQDEVVLLNERDADESRTADDFDILPKTSVELVELIRSSVKSPCFEEIPSRCVASKYCRENNPVFFLPGFKVSKTRNLISKLCYPSFMAKYPAAIKSIDEVASLLKKELVANFDLYMFTLVAEGWAGPLALKIADLLHAEGKTSEVILLEAAPNVVRKWSKNITKFDSIISSCAPLLKEGEDITVDHLKGCTDRLKDLISKEEEEEFLKEEVAQGLDIIVNRLQAIDSFKLPDHPIESTKVHVFTTNEETQKRHADITEMNMITRLPCTHHIVRSSFGESMLENEKMATQIAELFLLELKMQARKPKVEKVGTLDIYEFGH